MCFFGPDSKPHIFVISHTARYQDPDFSHNLHSFPLFRSNKQWATRVTRLPRFSMPLLMAHMARRSARSPVILGFPDIKYPFEYHFQPRSQQGLKSDGWGNPPSEFCDFTGLISQHLFFFVRISHASFSLKLLLPKNVVSLYPLTTFRPKTRGGTGQQRACSKKRPNFYSAASTATAGGGARQGDDAGEECDISDDVSSGRQPITIFLSLGFVFEPTPRHVTSPPSCQPTTTRP